VGGAYFFAISHWPLAIIYSLVALKHIVQHQKQDWKVAWKEVLFTRSQFGYNKN
jgi:hypothetical protein